MSIFEGHNLADARHVRVTRRSLVGAHRSEVAECVVEIEHDDGKVQEETVTFDPTYDLASFEASVQLVNRVLAARRQARER